MMSAVPATNRGRPHEGQGPVEQLLAYTEEILKLESRLRFARLLRRLARFSMIAIPIGIISIYFATALTWRKVNLRVVNWPAIILILLLCVYLVAYAIIRAPDNDPSKNGSEEGSEYNVPELELELELAHERRRLHAANINLDLRTRQLIYRDSIPQDIEKYRGEGTYYRRIHNFLQAVIIVGALAASTLTSLIQSNPQLRWFAVGTTFSVGVAAGFTGYFKFRERSFYLQQTSDAIEQELSAVSLGIGRYKGRGETEALTEFTEQAELLKIEQRKRQQQLEQPSEGREGTQ
jgi:hypothetical protein